MNFVTYFQGYEKKLINFQLYNNLQEMAPFYLQKENPDKQPFYYLYSKIIVNMLEYKLDLDKDQTKKIIQFV